MAYRLPDESSEPVLPAVFSHDNRMCPQTVDPETARKLSDEFMSDLIAHRPEATFNKTEPKFKRMVTLSDFAPQMDQMFQYCRAPQDSELKDVQAGYKIYADTHKNPIRKCIHAANTNQFAKGQCYFSVKIAPSSDGARVTSLGRLKVTS